MYLKYIEKKKWKCELIDEQVEITTRRSTFKVSAKGDEALKFFQKESGVHKMTRVSPFGGKGKKHTSCVALSCYEPLIQSKVTIPECELRWDTFRGTGAGGQHRNKRDTAVRLTHEPTNTVVTVLSGRSQAQNKQEAMNVLLTKLSERAKQDAQSKQKAHINRGQMGFGQAVRAYKLDQHLVKDERTGKIHHQPNKVLDGELDWCD
jgi:peptide chain release factor 2